MRYFLMPIIGLGVFAVLPLSLALPAYLGIATFSLFIYGKVMANDSERQFGVPTYN